LLLAHLAFSAAKTWLKLMWNIRQATSGGGLFSRRDIDWNTAQRYSRLRDDLRCWRQQSFYPAASEPYGWRNGWTRLANSVSRHSLDL